MTIKVLVLGHKGMLGNAVFKYFSSLPNYETITLDARFGDTHFENEVRSKSPDFIINCIGIIPQKKPDFALYESINIGLPLVLEGLNIPTIHPSTDCEFAGAINRERMYSKKDVRDAEDEYGRSKAIISEKIEKEFRNTKIIRTSIIGHEEKTHHSLLDWFLNSEGSVNGYTNHYWNGITTLEWAKQCRDLIEKWDTLPILNQFGTREPRSKYDLLNDINGVYAKNTKIIPFDAPETVNKCLVSDKEIPSIINQLKDLKVFYGK